MGCVRAQASRTWSVGADGRTPWSSLSWLRTASEGLVARARAAGWCPGRRDQGSGGAGQLGLAAEARQGAGEARALFGARAAASRSAGRHALAIAGAKPSAEGDRAQLGPRAGMSRAAGLLGRAAGGARPPRPVPRSNVHAVDVAVEVHEVVDDDVHTKLSGTSGAGAALVPSRSTDALVGPGAPLTLGSSVRRLPSIAA